MLLSFGVADHPVAAVAADPDTIQDVFFRIGGAARTRVSANVSLPDNAGNSILDDVWAWRADHGHDVGWAANRADGTPASSSPGQGGTDIFFQNELPYDPPSQSAWMATPAQDGYPAFVVRDNVTSFHGYAMGSYVVFISTKATLRDAEAFQAPDTPGVRFHNVFGVWIAGSGGAKSIINGVGGPVTSTNPGTVEPVDITSYP